MKNIIGRIPIINKIGGKKSKMSPSFGSSEEMDNMVSNPGNEMRSTEKKDVNILIDGIPNPRTINTPSELIFVTDRFRESYDNILKIKGYEDRLKFAEALHERLQRAIYLGKYWDDAKEVKDLRNLRNLLLSKYTISKEEESEAVRDAMVQ